MQSAKELNGSDAVKFMVSLAARCREYVLLSVLCFTQFMLSFGLPTVCFFFRGDSIAEDFLSICPHLTNVLTVVDEFSASQRVFNVRLQVMLGWLSFILCVMFTFRYAQEDALS